MIWKKKAGKSLPVSVAKELIESLRASRESGEDPGVGRTEKPVTGFRSRAGRTFRAKLRLEQTDEGKWRVEFDEEWAKEPPRRRVRGGARGARGGRPTRRRRGGRVRSRARRAGRLTAALRVVKRPA